MNLLNVDRSVRSRSWGEKNARSLDTPATNANLNKSSKTQLNQLKNEHAASKQQQNAGFVVLPYLINADHSYYDSAPVSPTAPMTPTTPTHVASGSSFKRSIKGSAKKLFNFSSFIKTKQHKLRSMFERNKAQSLSKAVGSEADMAKSCNSSSSSLATSSVCKMSAHPSNLATVLRKREALALGAHSVLSLDAYLAVAAAVTSAKDSSNTNKHTSRHSFQISSSKSLSSLMCKEIANLAEEKSLNYNQHHYHHHHKTACNSLQHSKNV